MKRRYSVAGWLVGISLFFALAHFSPAVTCRDGWASQSIGRQGACSHHGGVKDNGWFVLLSLAISIGSGVFTATKLHERSTKKSCEGQQESQSPSNSPPDAQLPDHLKRPPTNGLPPCPQCGGAMKIRHARRGRNKGNTFLGCSHYPRCRGTRPYKQDAP